VPAFKHGQTAYCAALNACCCCVCVALQAIGAAGAAALLSAVAARGSANARPGGKVTVLTHCNTGSLATAGYGTALGVVRALHEQGRLERCYACETRPYNQGEADTAGRPSSSSCGSSSSSAGRGAAVKAVGVCSQAALARLLPRTVTTADCCASSACPCSMRCYSVCRLLR
jgi:hypothetical protein